MRKPLSGRREAPARSFVLSATILLTASLVANCSGGGTSVPRPIVTPTPTPCRSCVAAEYQLAAGSMPIGTATGSDRGARVRSFAHLRGDSSKTPEQGEPTFCRDGVHVELD